MKTRQSFVSNSSTSSFIAVAVRDEKVVNQIKKKIGLNKLGDEWWDEIEDKGFENIGYGLYQHSDTSLELIGMSYDGEVDLIGIQIHDLLEGNNTVSECKDVLIDILADLGIEVTPDQIRFEFGECSNGS